MGTLDGKVALVTGAGRGIGAAIARKLADSGAKVVVSELDPDPAAETAAAITARGGNAVTLVGDVAAADFGERAPVPPARTTHPDCPPRRVSALWLPACVAQDDRLQAPKSHSRNPKTNTAPKILTFE